MKTQLKTERQIPLITECDKTFTCASQSENNFEEPNVAPNNLPVPNDVPKLARLLPVKMAKEYLFMKNERTFIRWCKRSCVTVLKEGKNKFIIQVEFFSKLVALSKSIMQEKYGENWEEGLEKSIQQEKALHTTNVKTHYKPQSELAQSLKAKWNY